MSLKCKNRESEGFGKALRHQQLWKTHSTFRCGKLRGSDGSVFNHKKEPDPHDEGGRGTEKRRTHNKRAVENHADCGKQFCAG